MGGCWIDMATAKENMKKCYVKHILSSDREASIAFAERVDAFSLRELR